MYAIAVTDQQLAWQEQPDPAAPKAGEIRIEVAWAGMNRADVMQRDGGYPPPPGASEILGLEVSGIVRELGPQVERFRVGDRVCALLAGGGYAEQVVVSEAQVLRIPESLNLQQAAALPEVFATAWLNLFMEARLSEGERVLLHAGASGVGTAAIQLCHAFGHPCYVTVGSQEKLNTCRSLGADDGWNRHDGSFVEAVRQWGGVDVILDPVGGDYLGWNQQVLNTEGRIVLIAFMGGRDTGIDLGRLLIGRQRLIGSTLRSRSPASKGSVMDALHTHVWPLIDSGRIKPLVDRTWPIQEADTAMRYLESNDSTGKLLLKVSGA
ncbi:NAD(P)H-quinone oxidoreductase [Kushneria phosphatilytica]|uniref:NAD(P)H-quinone oxidoreductase n=1 Tax=Kushneria phosphatilytica TaxID=657387 RepID=A0A1S1NVP9_9GAMM|nr:NAD(P)H-quinone oxidoreductase [Kushneria phosphatilytica]OHV10852.1 NAD(P)H-quinone oxidoreductase [Kushneria phosphatilytica]QEL12064.1 NAD(P)H-quinone oxidoreductase [Kushneria phosphatilytica]